MRLSSDELQMAVEGLRSPITTREATFMGRPAPINPVPRTSLAPRAKVRPDGSGPRRRAWSVAIRAVTATGIVFVDGNCWMDGETFILQLPPASELPAMLCRITHWQPLDSDLFVVSANFVRPLNGLPRPETLHGARKRHSTRR
jgi:hypothetical protein